MPLLLILSKTMPTELVCTTRDIFWIDTRFALEEAGHLYSRSGNPTVDVFERVIRLVINTKLNSELPHSNKGSVQWQPHQEWPQFS
jgi:hypothetical protein